MNTLFTKKRKLLPAWFVILILIISLTGLQACNSNLGDSNSKARINVSMTDAPASFQAVTVNITEIDIHKNGADSSSGWQTISTQPTTVNLLDLANGKTKLLGSNTIDAGDYSQIRLILGGNSTVTTMDGTTHALTVPSGSQTGIKVNANISVSAGETFNLLLDFNAASSVHQTGNGRFMLKPVIHSVTTQIEGSVSGDAHPPEARPAIFALSGSDTVSSTFADTTTGAFKIVGLTAGTYSLAFNPSDTLYKDTTVTGVQIMSGNNTTIDTVRISRK